MTIDMNSRLLQPMRSVLATIVSPIYVIAESPYHVSHEARETLSTRESLRPRTRSSNNAISNCRRSHSSSSRCAKRTRGCASCWAAANGSAPKCSWPKLSACTEPQHVSGRNRQRCGGWCVHRTGGDRCGRIVRPGRGGGAVLEPRDARHRRCARGAGAGQPQRLPQHRRRHRTHRPSRTRIRARHRRHPRRRSAGEFRSRRTFSARLSGGRGDRRGGRTDHDLRASHRETVGGARPQPACVVGVRRETEQPKPDRTADPAPEEPK